jgi:hypothetical protein
MLVKGQIGFITELRLISQQVNTLKIVTPANSSLSFPATVPHHFPISAFNATSHSKAAP